MSVNNKYLALIFSLIILSGCHDRMVPTSYIPHTKEVSLGPFGSWIEVKTTLDSITKLSYDLDGELLAIESDTLYMITVSGLVAIHTKMIDEARLHLFAPRKEYFIGFLALTPNLAGVIFTGDYAGGFFVIGIPLIVTTLILAINKGNEVLKYPKKTTLSEFAKFSRYPQGISFNINRDSLNLKY